MSYNITVTNGSPITIATGAIDNSTSLSLIGKNVPNYGELIAQNLVNLLQNFAGTAQPSGVVTGQIWYDTSSDILKSYNGSSFDRIANIVVSASTATGRNPGDLWWDTTNVQLKVYSGSTWVVIGPAVAASSPIIADTIYDNTNISHQVSRIVVDGVNVAVISSQTFTAKTSYAGLTNIVTGLTLVQGQFYGRASSASYADLAEYYTSDEEYSPGTVLMIGGTAEVTAANLVGTTLVVGVVSENPAYLMNDNCASLRVAVALVGRVPCKVIGDIRKGDLLIASDISGVAISSAGPNSGSIIGKALQSYNSTEVGNIEIIVGKH